MSGAPVSAEDVAPERFVGSYRFLEDGWRGTLELADAEGRRLTGLYRTDRYQGQFEVRAEVDPDQPHMVSIRIAEFNEMAEQLFVGHLLRSEGNVIAGTTEAEQTTFGFVARKARSLLFASFRPGDVEPEDFAGRYELHEDDRRGVLSLTVDASDRLSGTYTQIGESGSWQVVARVGELTRHEVQMQIAHPDGAATRRYTGYLATRPKNVVAGSAEHAGTTVGFYMVKLSDEPGAHQSSSAR